MIWLVLMLLAILQGCTPEETFREIQPGDPIPRFRVTLDDGSALSSEDLSEGTAVIVFFNTGCPDCRRELPLIQEWWEAQDSDIRIVAISREEGEESVRRFWMENNMTIPFSAQEDRRVYSLFAREGIPRIYVFENRILTTIKL